MHTIQVQTFLEIQLHIMHFMQSCDMVHSSNFETVKIAVS